MLVRAYLASAVVALGLCASAAFADGIEPGLWKIVTRTEVGGVAGSSRESARCLTAEQTGDLATTFSPVAGTINSECAPIERSLAGGKLTWRLVCKGQLNMELTGEFNFDTPHHYSATVRTQAGIAGMPATHSQSMVEAEWVSQCP